MKANGRRVIFDKTSIFVVATIIAGLAGWHRYAWPHGHRACFLPCLTAALRMYAEDHGSQYPDDLFSTNTLDALKPSGLGDNLAGLSGDIDETRRRFQSGKALDSTVSSWVYWGGFSANDSPDLAIIWDQKRGLAFNGRRANGSAVGFADGNHRLIPNSEWEEFLKRQEVLRTKTILARVRTNSAASVTASHSE